MLLDGGCFCALAAALPALAQSSAPAALAPVVITGNPLNSENLAIPASVLAGTGLVLRRGSSLGETLSGLPGVSSSWFGPNANRPVIRGQDGERIRVLGNGGATLDASALSFDHAVPIEPLVVERLEVLRGPAALLYGGSAIGGVVNAIDNRIPKAAIEGIGGALELRGGGAARERSAGALLEAGGGTDGPGGRGFALHADAFTRRTDDLRVPDFDRPVEGGSERRDRIVNSASEAEGGALGGSMVWGQGYLGASVDTYRNDYGIVAEEDVLIRMQRDKLALAGEWRELGGWIRTVRARLQGTDYEHEEVEGTGEVGTTFSNKGEDGRIELEHAPLGGLKGVFGLQGESAKFEALGEEAFVPNTETRQWALFVHEELALAGASRLSFGARVERSRIESRGDVDASEPKFGDAQDRRFTATSAALGGVWDLAASMGSGWQASGNLAYTERAPASYELYANGVHLATSAFERGDADLDLERGGNLDVAIEWKSGANRLRAGAFVSRFSNYIALLRSGEPDFVSDEGDSVPVYAFEGVKARLQGIELEGAWRAIDAEGSLDLEAQLDALRADNRSTGEPLPRIAPLRIRLGAVYSLAGWTLRGDVVRAQRQSRVPADDERTPAYTLLNLALSKRLTVGMSDALLFVRLDNATDELAFNAGSISTVRRLAPLPGRSLSAGLRMSF
jgi:iron complex outermembrane receptor protein